jgi:hypothetical protein
LQLSQMTLASIPRTGYICAVANGRVGSMTSASAFRDQLVTATGASGGDLIYKVRLLQDAGMVGKAGRGRSAAHLETAEVVAITIAMMLQERGSTSSMLIERVQSALRLQCRGLVPPFESPTAALSDDWQGLSLGDALAQLVERAMTSEGRRDIPSKIRGIELQGDASRAVISEDIEIISEDLADKALWSSLANPARAFFLPSPTETENSPIPMVERVRLARLSTVASVPGTIIGVLADAVLDTRKAKSKTGATVPAAAPALDTLPASSSEAARSRPSDIPPNRESQAVSAQISSGQVVRLPISKGKHDDHDRSFYPSTGSAW